MHTSTKAVADNLQEKRIAWNLIFFSFHVLVVKIRIIKMCHFMNFQSSIDERAEPYDQKGEDLLLKEDQVLHISNVLQ